ncbi:hypothetical protein GCM10023094_12810 [Rhodococcus olei]|uniref:Small secreted domain DUF320 n=1 Tax=Rhodococcus olei TaxID=2161675 RepID=A0ABP8NZ56_9NOCA
MRTLIHAVIGVTAVTAPVLGVSGVASADATAQVSTSGSKAVAAVTSTDRGDTCCLRFGHPGQTLRSAAGETDSGLCPTTSAPLRGVNSCDGGGGMSSRNRTGITLDDPPGAPARILPTVLRQEQR